MSTATLAALAAGSLLGFLSSYLLARYQQRHELLKTMIDQFLASRKELCGLLSTLASLEVASLDSVDCSGHGQQLSKLYYSHYDILPAEVLRQMNCLYACLADKDNRPYKCQDRILLPMNDSDILEAVDRVSLVENYRLSAPFFLLGADAGRRRTAAINLQARLVLRSINSFYSLPKFASWSSLPPKKSG